MFFIILTAKKFPHTKYFLEIDKIKKIISIKFPA